MRTVVAYRAIPDRPGWATGDAVCTALKKLGHDVISYAKTYQRPEWTEIDNLDDVDLLIYLECNDNDPQYTYLKDVARRSVYWEFDTAMHRDFSRHFVEDMGFDRVYTANRKIAQSDGFERWSYLPYAADVEKFKPRNGKNRDAALIGSRFPNREQFAATANIPIISGIYGEDYARQLARLKVSVHYYASGGDGLIVARPFETMACGVCLLSERDPALEAEFVPGNDYVAYADADDCKKHLQKLLNDADHREWIAGNGYDIITTRHTYLHRMRKILSDL